MAAGMPLAASNLPCFIVRRTDLAGRSGRDGGLAALAGALALQAFAPMQWPQRPAW